MAAFHTDAFHTDAFHTDAFDMDAAGSSHPGGGTAGSSRPYAGAVRRRHRLIILFLLGAVLGGMI